MKQDKALTQQDVDDAVVRLKPVFGIPPGRYLAALYGFLVLFALIMLLLWPGIRHPGSYYVIDADPPGAAVFVDGVYADSAPCRIFVAAGAHDLSVGRPGFATVTESVTTRGRLFASLLVPRVERLSFALDRPSGTAVLAAGVREFAAWSMTGTPSDAYQLPMTLSDAARAWSAEPSPVPAGFPGAALSYASSAPSVRDALRASSIALGSSAALTPATLGRLVKAAAAELSVDPALLAALAGALPDGAKAALESSPLYRRLLDTATTEAATAVPARSSAGGTVAEIALVSLGASTTVIRAGAALPRTAFVPGFSLAAREVTVARFREFVEAVPEWAPSRAESLAARGLAEPDYLSGFDAATPGEPVRHVSAYAAEAYCAWLSRQAPAGFRFELPTEARWAAAAAAAGDSALAVAVLFDGTRNGPVGDAAADAAGFSGLLGNVWEWCADSFAVHPAAGANGRASWPVEERVVRGGSWANKPGLVDLSSRGAIPARECSPYLGFRVALVKLDTE